MKHSIKNKANWGNKSFYKDNVHRLYKNLMRSGPIVNNDFHHYRNKGACTVDPDILSEAAKTAKELNLKVLPRSTNQKPVYIQETLRLAR